MSAHLHFAIINDFGIFAETNAVCGNNFRRRKLLTEDWQLVTCPTCRKLCGFDEQLTETHGDPLRRAA